MIDEGIAVALKAEDDVVAPGFETVHRILFVPDEQVREDAHKGHGFILTGLEGIDENVVVGQTEIRLGDTGDAMDPALVANIHVEKCSGHIPSPTAPGLPGTGSERTGGPAGISGIGPGAPTSTVVKEGRFFRTAGVAETVGLVAAGAVVAGIGGEKVVTIRVGIVGRAIVGKTVGLRPTMLPVVGTDPAGDLRVAGVPIDIEDIPRVVGVLVRHIENVPGVGGRGGVGEAGVVVDDLVERRP